MPISRSAAKHNSSNADSHSSSSHHLHHPSRQDTTTHNYSTRANQQQLDQNQETTANRQAVTSNNEQNNTNNTTSVGNSADGVRNTTGEPSSTTPSLEPHTGSLSCHQCKTRRDKSLLVVCTAPAPVKPNAKPNHRSLVCIRLYCHACLSKCYHEHPPTKENQWSWICPACRNQCTCKKCAIHQVAENSVPYAISYVENAANNNDTNVSNSTIAGTAAVQGPGAIATTTTAGVASQKPKTKTPFHPHQPVATTSNTQHTTAENTFNTNNAYRNIPPPLPPNNTATRTAGMTGGAGITPFLAAPTHFPNYHPSGSAAGHHPSGNVTGSSSLLPYPPPAAHVGSFESPTATAASLTRPAGLTGATMPQPNAALFHHASRFVANSSSHPHHLTGTSSHLLGSAITAWPFQPPIATSTNRSSFISPSLTSPFNFAPVAAPAPAHASGPTAHASGAPVVVPAPAPAPMNVPGLAAVHAPVTIPVTGFAPLRASAIPQISSPQSSPQGGSSSSCSSSSRLQPSPAPATTTAASLAQTASTVRPNVTAHPLTTKRPRLAGNSNDILGGNDNTFSINAINSFTAFGTSSSTLGTAPHLVNSTQVLFAQPIQPSLSDQPCCAPVTNTPSCVVSPRGASIAPQLLCPDNSVQLQPTSSDDRTSSTTNHAKN